MEDIIKLIDQSNFGIKGREQAKSICLKKLNKEYVEFALEFLELNYNYVVDEFKSFLKHPDIAGNLEYVCEQLVKYFKLEKTIKEILKGGQYDI